MYNWNRLHANHSSPWCVYWLRVSFFLFYLQILLACFNSRFNHSGSSVNLSCTLVYHLPLQAPVWTGQYLASCQAISLLCLCSTAQLWWHIENWASYTTTGFSASSTLVFSLKIKWGRTEILIWKFQAWWLCKCCNITNAFPHEEVLTDLKQAICNKFRV